MLKCSAKDLAICAALILLEGAPVLYGDLWRNHRVCSFVSLQPLLLADEMTLPLHSCSSVLVAV